MCANGKPPPRSRSQNRLCTRTCAQSTVPLPSDASRGNQHCSSTPPRASADPPRSAAGPPAPAPPTPPRVGDDAAAAPLPCAAPRAASSAPSSGAASLSRTLSACSARPSLCATSAAYASSRGAEMLVSVPSEVLGVVSWSSSMDDDRERARVLFCCCSPSLVPVPSRLVMLMLFCLTT